MKIARLIYSLLFLLCLQIPLLAQENQSQGDLFHVLLLQWNEKADSAQQAPILDLFRNLPSKIDGFEQAKFIKPIRANKDHELIIIMRFESQAALDVYQKHPDHLKIKELALPLLEDLTKYDYWEHEL